MTNQNKYDHSWNKCSACGRFISYADFESGAATSVMITPDSEFSKEEFEVLCAKCKTKEACDAEDNE